MQDQEREKDMVEKSSSVPDTPTPVSDEQQYREIQEAIAIHGDYSKLTEEQRKFLLLYLCKIHGLDPSTRPFSYLKIADRRSGKIRTVLYAHKAATDGIAKNLKLSDEYLKIHELPGGAIIYEVAVVDQEYLSSGGKAGVRKICVGSVPPGINGLDLANAHKKAETQAHRRAILAIACPGVLDESEVEDMPGEKIEEDTIRPAEKPKPAKLPKPSHEVGIPKSPLPKSVGAFSKKKPVKL